MTYMGVDDVITTVSSQGACRMWYVVHGSRQRQKFRIVHFSGWNLVSHERSVRYSREN